MAALLTAALSLLPSPRTVVAGGLAPHEQLQAAAHLLDGWQVEAAGPAIAALAAAYPSDPDVLFLDGELAFYQGDYRRAVVKLDAAAKATEDPAAKSLEQLAASAAGVTDGFSVDRSAGGHFEIAHARGKDDLLVPYAGIALEAQYAALAHDLGTAPPGPVRVEIYEDADDLAQTTGLTKKDIETSGTIAICKWNRLMVTTPRALARGYPWMDTLAHEYTHFVLTRASADAAPLWLQEGIAKYEEQRWRSPAGSPMDAQAEGLLARAERSGEWVTFAEMHPSFAKLPSQEAAALAFAEVRSVVEYLLFRKGYEGLRALVAALRGGAPEALALRTVYGEDTDALWNDWKGWIGGKGLRLHPGVAAPKLTLAPAPGAGGGERDDDQDAIDGIAERRARRAARLGGLLRVHHRLQAAAIEYEKAAAILGPQNEIIANRLARTYLELGQPDRAIAAAKPTAALYPTMAGPHATLGQAYLLLGDEARAEGELWAALQVSPFDPRVHCGLARIYQDRGKALDAVREGGTCAELGGSVPPPVSGASPSTRPTP